MTKAELDILEKGFEAEINGSIYQTKSKIAKKLCEEGYLQEVELNFKGVICNGYVTSLLGNMTYCQSERCKEASDD